SRGAGFLKESLTDSRHPADITLDCASRGMFMSGHRGKLFLSALLASSALTGVTSAFADNAIETVVVTAEKRTEDLQKTPLSIQVLSTKKLEELHISSFNDYAQYLP